VLVSVLQWNVWSQEDIGNIASFLKAQDADIVCLQELGIGYPGQSVANTPQFIAEQLGYHHFYQEIPIEDDERTIVLANGIFSRFPIMSTGFSWINRPQGDGGYDDQHRAYIEADLDLDGRTLHIGTTHMSYTHRFGHTCRKQEETDLLLDELAKHSDNFIFTGDLNALPGSYTISSIEALLKDAGPPHEHKSWTTKPFSYDGFDETELNWRPDYVFASPDVEILSSEILETKYSDHLPILTELFLP